MAGGLESVAASQEDVLFPGLHDKLPQGAQYVSGRRFATFYPQGSNVHSPTSGTRLIRFVLSDATSLLDLSTFRLAFTLANTSADRELRPTGHPGMCRFQRAGVYVGGWLIEDVLYSNRLGTMLDKLKPPQRLWSEAIEMIGQVNDDQVASHDVSYAAGPRNLPIPANTRQTILTPIMSGLLATHYMLPGRFPLTLEIELVASAGQCCAVGAALPVDNNPTADNPGLGSQSFEITQPRILCDVVSVDAAVQDQLSKVLLEGGALPLHFTSWSTTMHSVLPADAGGFLSWDVTLSRAFSRIKDVWITFDSVASYGIAATETNTFLNWHGKPNYNVYGATNPYRPGNGEGWSFQLQTGSVLWPDIPMSSTKEAFYQLSKVLGMHSSNEGVSIPPSEYLGTSFILALDLEKMSSSPGAGAAAFTGLSTRNAGDTMRFAFKNVLARNGASTPSRMYVTLHFDAVVELRAEGCVLLD